VNHEVDFILDDAVDFILDDEVGIEVKAATRAQKKQLAGLRTLREEGVLRRFILVCRNESPLFSSTESKPCSGGTSLMHCGAAGS
jgi:hypothetical protein